MKVITATLKAFNAAKKAFIASMKSFAGARMATWKRECLQLAHAGLHAPDDALQRRGTMHHPDPGTFCRSSAMHHRCLEDHRGRDAGFQGSGKTCMPEQEVCMDAKEPDKGPRNAFSVVMIALMAASETCRAARESFMPAVV
jgi:hypothetical protein